MIKQRLSISYHSLRDFLTFWLQPTYFSQRAFATDAPCFWASIGKYLGQVCSCLTAVPDVQCCFKDWVTHSGTDAPWVLELSQSLQSQGVDILPILKLVEYTTMPPIDWGTKLVNERAVRKARSSRLLPAQSSPSRMVLTPSMVPYIMTSSSYNLSIRCSSVLFKKLSTWFNFNLLYSLRTGLMIGTIPYS